MSSQSQSWRCVIHISVLGLVFVALALGGSYEGSRKEATRTSGTSKMEYGGGVERRGKPCVTQQSEDGADEASTEARRRNEEHRQRLLRIPSQTWQTSPNSRSHWCRSCRASLCSVNQSRQILRGELLWNTSVPRPGYITC
jgi:hypothetical protein